MNPVKSKNGKLNLQVRSQVGQPAPTPLNESDLAMVSTSLSDEDLSEVAAYGRTSCIVCAAKE